MKNFVNKYKLVILIFVLLLNFTVKSEEVNFAQGNYKDILELAQKENKIVMIDFFTDWCKWCVELDNVVYKDESVAQYANTYQINWKIDAEKGEGIELAKQYKVKGYPTIIFVQADGTEIDRIVGYLKPTQFLEKMKNFNEGINTIGKIKLALLQNPNDVEANFLMGKKYVDYYEMESALPYFKKVMDLDQENKAGFTDDAILYYAYITNDKNLFMELLTMDTDSEVLIQAIMFIAEITYQNDNNYEKAYEYYLKLLDEYKDNEDVKFSYSQFLLTWIYSIANNPNSSIDELNKAIKLSEECLDYVRGTANEASLYYRMSTIFYKTSEYQKALDYINKAIEIFDNKNYQQQKQKVLEKISSDGIQK